jgi:hypothetical protein
VTNPSDPQPRTERVRTGTRSADVDRLAAAAGATRAVAVTALVLAVLAIGLVAVGLITARASCQDQAWNVGPSPDDLPAGWSIAATQYDLSRKTMSLVGPMPADEYTAQAQAITTITCFEQGAADAVSRSRQASVDADQSVEERNDLGDGGFSAVDVSGATFLQLRKDRIVVYIASSAETSAREVDQLASAFDVALGGDGGTIAPETPAASVDPGLESFDPDETLAPEPQAAPDLVAMLPVSVGDLNLIADSATGSTFLGDDQGSRAVLAALRAEDKQPDDLRVAQAYDEFGESDLSILAVTVDGLSIAQTRGLVLGVWLAATGPGVTQEPIELAGRSFTRIDYGDGGRISYVLAEDPVVLVISTADPALAEATAAALP